MDNLELEQVSSFHNLCKFVRKLGIAGLIKTSCIPMDYANYHRRLYSLSVESYDPSMRGKFTGEEILEEYFRLSGEIGGGDELFRLRRR